MLINKTVSEFLQELASHSPAPGGGSVAALAGALGTGLIAMVCRLTLGKKKYEDVQAEMEKTLKQAERIREIFTALIDRDTEAFNKLMEAYGLPKETDEQKALRDVAIQSTTKEAALIPLEVMHHCVDALATAKVVAQKGNTNAISDAGTSALMLGSALESAALNVRINLSAIKDAEFVVWKSGEVDSFLKTGRAETESILAIVNDKIAAR